MILIGLHGSTASTNMIMRQRQRILKIFGGRSELRNFRSQIVLARKSGKNPIAVRNKEFHVEFDKEKLLSGTYNLKYELDETGFDKQGRSLSSEGWDVQYKVHI